MTKKHLSITELPSNKQLVEALNDKAVCDMPTQSYRSLSCTEGTITTDTKGKATAEFISILSGFAKKKIAVPVQIATGDPRKG